MSPEVRLRAMHADDYDAVVRLWQGVEGVEIAEGDDRESITRYLARNPGLSRVAVLHERIVGAVLCGHDGRRGLIYHLAVADELRGRGIGQRLVDECVEGLRRSGVKRALILVVKENSRGRAFWEARGFEEISGATAYGVDL